MRERDPAGSRRFRLPLALLTASLVFAGLFLAGAALDLRHLEAALVGVLETEGLSLVEGVGQLADERAANYLRADAEPAAANPALGGEPLVGQEAVAAALLEAARSAQPQLGPDASPEALGALAREWGLPGVLVLDAAGRVVRQSGPVPSGYIARLRRFLEGQGEIAFDFSRSLSDDGFVGFLALRPAGGAGVVLLVDREGLRRWADRLALQEAVETLGERRGVVYAAAADGAGRVLAQLGEPPAAPVGAGGAGPSHPRRLGVGGRAVLEVAAPLVLGGGTAVRLRVGLDAENVDRLLRRARLRGYRSAGLTLGIGLVAVAALFWGQGRYHRRLAAFSERLQQAERLSALGKLAAGLAHEIRNPLNAIGLAAQRIQREHSAAVGPGGEVESLGRLTGVIRDEVRRLNRLIEDFLRLSPAGPPKLEPTPLEPFVRDVLALVEVEAKARGVALEASFTAPRCIVRLDADRLRQALLNLLRNALEAIPDGGGAVRVRLEPSGAREVVVRIEDTGVGISPENLERVFDPDFTTKERGLGLGLPLAYEVVRGHGGRLGVRSVPGAGTTFELFLPCETAG